MRDFLAQLGMNTVKYSVSQIITAAFWKYLMKMTRSTSKRFLMSQKITILICIAIMMMMNTGWNVTRKIMTYYD